VKRFLAALLVALLPLGIAGCSLFPSAPKEWNRGTGDISIVATTNVWADLAYQIGGKVVTSHAIIFNVNQDPHSYEASVRDQLLVEKADLVIVNGGGYDDFMLQLSKENNYKNAPVINAVEVAGTRADGNEHIWFSIERVRVVAAEIASRLKSIALPDAASDIDANLAKLNNKLDELQARIEELKPVTTGKNVVLVEPLASYLVEALGEVDVTPADFSRAVEEERDVPPAAAEELKKLLRSNQVSLLVFNSATSGTPAQKLMEANSANIPATQIDELLMQDPDNFEWSGDYFEYVDSAIRDLALFNGVDLK
jgi:zinc/manganese transport system substrate-binding protein